MELIAQAVLFVDDLHATTTTTCGCFQDDRETNPLHGSKGFIVRLDDAGAGQNRDAVSRHGRARLDFVAHQPHVLGQWPNEGQAGATAYFGKLGIFP